MKDAEKMQQAERERLELEFKQKARDFQFQSKELNEAKAIADRDMLKQLKPKLDKAVEEVIKQGNYDLVLERGAVVEVKPQYEITRQVIERMNSAALIHERSCIYPWSAGRASAPPCVVPRPSRSAVWQPCRTPARIS